MPCNQPFRDDTQQMLLFKIASCLAEGGAVAGVASFNGRTGIVTLTSGDVIAALGCTPACEADTISQADGDARYVLKAGDTMTGSLNIANSAILVASDPALDITQTWNNAAVTFTGLQSNITETAAGQNSNLFNFQVGGVDRFNFTLNGTLRAVRQDATDSGLNLILRKRGNAGGATNAVASDSTIGSVRYSGWDGTAFADGSRISGLASEAWTNIAHGSRIDLYTTPVGSVAEQITLRLSHTGQSQFLDGTAALPALTFQSDPDTGVLRAGPNLLAFATGGVQRFAIDSFGNSAAGGLPYNSAPFTSIGTLLSSSAGGTWGLVSRDLTSMALGVGGSILFVGYKTGTSAAGNFAGIKGIKENGTAADESGALVLFTSTSAGTLLERFRITSTGDSQIQISNALTWSGRANISSPADGIVLLRNAATTDFSRLQFGGTTSSFPSIKRSGATLQFRLADDSAFAGIATAGIVMSLAAPLSFTSGANTRAGNAVLVAGTVTVANTSVTANTIVIVTRKTAGGTIGFAVTYTVIAATSFTLTSDSALDTSTYSYILIENP